MLARIDELVFFIRSDLWRYAGRASASTFLVHLLTQPGFAYTFWMRLCAFLRKRRVTKFTLYPFAKLLMRHCKYKFGIDIHETTRVGPGLFIGHFGGIVVSARAVLGKDCNLSQGVTIGETNRGVRRGCPILGDRVYVGPGAKIIGAVRIGDNVAIGANCVVTKDLPDSAVAVGVPARVVSFQGSVGYVDNTDYV